MQSLGISEALQCSGPSLLPLDAPYKYSSCFALRSFLTSFGQCLTPTNFRARPRMHLFHFLLNNKKTLLVSTVRSQALSLSL